MDGKATDALRKWKRVSQKGILARKKTCGGIYLFSGQWFYVNSSRYKHKKPIIDVFNS